MTGFVRVCLVWVFLVAIVCPASAAPTKGTSVQISIRVIYAVKAGVHSVDPALKDIQGELLELPFSKFRLLDRLEANVQIKSTLELQFPGDRTIAVTFNGVDTSMGKKLLSLQVAIKPTAKIGLRVADGGRTMFIGPKHLEGTLIVDISAKLKEVGK